MTVFSELVALDLEQNRGDSKAPTRRQILESRNIGHGGTDISGETSDRDLEVDRAASFHGCTIAASRSYSSDWCSPVAGYRSRKWGAGTTGTGSVAIASVMRKGAGPW